MTEQEQADLSYNFSFQTGLKVEVELLFSDVVIIPELQAFDVLHLRAIEYWITNRFMEVNRNSHQLPKLCMIPQGQTRYAMGVRLSQTQAVKMLNKNKVAEIVGKF